jgi:hypothetical protein
MSRVTGRKFRRVRPAQAPVPRGASGNDIAGLQAPAHPALSEIRIVQRQVHPPDAVVIPKMVVRVIPIDAERSCWVFQGRLGFDGSCNPIVPQPLENLGEPGPGTSCGEDYLDLSFRLKLRIRVFETASAPWPSPARLPHSGSNHRSE